MISLLWTLFLFLLMGLLVINSPTAAQAALEGLLLCGSRLIPSLFPFFVVSGLLPGQKGIQLLALPLKPVTRLAGLRSPRAPLILLLSWCGGYAVSAQLIRDEVKGGQLSEREAQLLLILGCTSSPGFVIGAVGGSMLGNPRLGLCFYTSCLVGNLLCAIVYRLFLPPIEEFSPSFDSEKPLSLSQAIQNAVFSCLTVCGCVIFFRVMTALLADLLGMDRAFTAFVSGLLEISGGCAALAEEGGMLSVYGICGALSLLSGSVFLQMSSLLEGQCSLRGLVLTRPLHLVSSLGILSLLLRSLPENAPVYSSLSPRLVLTSRSSPDTAMLLFLLCLILLRTLQQKDRPKMGGQKPD